VVHALGVGQRKEPARVRATPQGFCQGGPGLLSSLPEIQADPTPISDPDPNFVAIGQARRLGYLLNSIPLGNDAVEQSIPGQSFQVALHVGIGSAVSRLAPAPLN